MPAENAYDVLKEKYPKLVEDVLDKSEEISTLLILMYSHILYSASENPNDPRDMYFRVEIMEDALLKVSMLYKTDSDSSRIIIPGKDPGKRNLNLVRLMQVNTSVAKLAVDVVEILENWIKGNQRRKDFGLLQLKFVESMFWKNLVFTSELVLKVEFEEMVRAKMNWPADESTEEGGVVIQ